MLSYLSFYATRLSDNEGAERFAEDAVAVAEALDDDRVSSAALSALADVYSAKGEHEQAFARYEEVAVLRARLGDPLLLTDAVYSLGKEAFHAGDDARARRELRSRPRAGARARRGAVPGRGSAPALARRPFAPATPRAPPCARERRSACTRSSRTTGRVRGASSSSATSSAERGDAELAARLTGAAEALRGDESPDEFEAPLLERYLHGLEASLGTDSLAALTAQRAEAGNPVARTGGCLGGNRGVGSSAVDAIDRR